MKKLIAENEPSSEIQVELPVVAKEEEVSEQVREIPEEPTKSLTDVIREIFTLDQQIKSLDDEVQEACVEEDFERADQIQQQIDSLKDSLAQLEKVRDQFKENQA